ncbi:MAG: outer membrane protein assembly factor BamC [Burkholderiales bacterium]
MRVIPFVQMLCCVAAGVLLAACSSIEIPTKKIDYKSSGKLPPLEIPPDLTRPSADDRFTVPDINPKGTATASDYYKDRAGRPQVSSSSASVLPEGGGDARVERSGTQRWLVVKGDPAKIWPVVKDFWQETGFIVNVEMPEAGVMETDWAENRAKIDDGFVRRTLGRVLDSIYSTGERDKFRTRLERGAAGTTEIYVSHRGMEEVFTSSEKDQTKWQPRKPDPGLEAEMLTRLMTRFGVQEARAKQQVASGADTPKASLAKQRGGGKLMLNEQFDRAWRRVGLALDRVGFTVEDRDRSKGLYFVRYIDPETDVKTKDEKQGFFGRVVSGMKFWGNSPAKKNEQYQIAVRDIDAGAEVNVLTKDGRPEASATSERILTLLYDQLK